MSNLFITWDQIFIAVSSLLLLFISFSELNNCTKSTRLPVRLSLVVLMTSSAGILLLIAGNYKIPWIFGTNVLGIAVYLLSNRRILYTPNRIPRKQAHS